MVGGSANTFAKAIFLDKSLCYAMFCKVVQHSEGEEGKGLKEEGLRAFPVVGGSPTTFAKAIFLDKSLCYAMFCKVVQHSEGEEGKGLKG